MLPSGTGHYGQSDLSPQRPQGLFHTVDHRNTAFQELQIAPVPLLVVVLDFFPGDPVLPGQVESAPPLDKGNLPEEGFRQPHPGPEQKLAGRLEIEFFRIHQDAIVVPEYGFDHFPLPDLTAS